MRFISLFSGAGGFDLGLEAAGWECVAQVEWDKECQQVLGYRWPEIPKWWDISTVNGADLPAADAVVFGSPCQDLSLAGLRAGLGGSKSGLFFEAIRIIEEMQHVGNAPAWVVWENVVGALSSNHGDDFKAVIDSFAEIGALDIGWRVLDARFFGVPQRRRRVFVVADFVGERVGQVLFESESSIWHPEPSLAPWTQTACGVGGSVDRTVAATLNSGGNNGGFRTEPEEHLVAFHMTQDPITGTTYTPQLTTGAPGGAAMLGVMETTTIGFSHTQGLDCQPSTEHWPTLRREGAGHAVATSTVVRRLTPLECERLMGWPDNHTAHRADGSQMPDSHRYKMCGNGVAGTVAQWLGERIMRAL